MDDRQEHRKQNLHERGGQRIKSTRFGISTGDHFTLFTFSNFTESANVTYPNSICCGLFKIFIHTASLLPLSLKKRPELFVKSLADA